jgi:hypothetical protein
LVKGPPVSGAAPWGLRVHRLDTQSKEPRITFGASGTAVPPLPGERLIRWAFIARHQWLNAREDPENIWVQPTRFVEGRNVPGGHLVGINDPFPGQGDIVLVTLARPIEIPDGVEVPPLGWDHIPGRGDSPEIYGFGDMADNVLRVLGAGGGALVENLHQRQWAPVVLAPVVAGEASEGGNSSGPVHVNGRIVGTFKGRHKYKGVIGTGIYWTPLHQK